VYTNIYEKRTNVYAQARKYKSPTRVFAIVFFYSVFFLSVFFFVIFSTIVGRCSRRFSFWTSLYYTPFASHDDVNHVLHPSLRRIGERSVGQISNADAVLCRVPKIEYVHRTNIMIIIIIIYQIHRVVGESTFRLMRRRRRKHRRWWRGKNATERARENPLENNLCGTRPHNITMKIIINPIIIMILLKIIFNILHESDEAGERI